MRIFGRFSNFDKCRPEGADDVISGVALEYVVTDVSASFGDYKLNIGRIIRSPAGPVLCTFVQYLVTFCSRPEATGDFISGWLVGPIVLDKCAGV